MTETKIKAFILILTDLKWTDMKKWSAGKLWYDFVRKYWIYYLLGIFSVLLTNLMQIIIPKIMGWTVDLLKNDPIPNFLKRPSVLESFYFLFYILAFVSLLLMVSRAGWRIFLLRQGLLAGGWLRSKVWDHVRFFPQDKLEQEYKSGMLMSISNSDVNYGSVIFGGAVMSLVDFSVLGSLALISMFLINRDMTLLTLILFLLIPISVKMLAKLEKEKYHNAQNSLVYFNNRCSQTISTIKLQRITQMGIFWIKRLIESAQEYQNRKLDAAYTSLLWILLMGAISIISYIILFTVGVHKVFQGELTIGDFIVMQSYIFLLQGPLLQLGHVISEWQRARISLNRLSSIYNDDRDICFVQDGKEIVESERIFVVENLSFMYPGGERNVIDKLSFVLKKGQRLGITGPIGAGKTTLVNLLSGLNRNFNGKISFFEQDIKLYSHQTLLKYICLVSQRPFLFADTIRNNLCLDTNITDEQIWDCLQIAGLKSDVERFPDKLDTFLGEWGINLSGGQKQRLTLARVLARKPGLLFLDDCLSAVDTVTEDHILNAVDQRLKETTIIWVAHRKSTLKYCDKILEMSS
ncbi:MAG: ABC transporter ATP-binding protein [bacterium]|nr:ABC transporter ATP-binding protein [bacterium]